MDTIRLCDIKIRDDFMETKPRKEKIKQAIGHIKRYKKIDKPIIMKDGVLVDNYARYLAASIVGLKEVPYMELQNISYIVGKFKNHEKEYVWKNDKGLDINVGDKVFVKVKRNDGKTKRVCVTVVDMFTSDDLDLYKKHKSIIKKSNR